MRSMKVAVFVVFAITVLCGVAHVLAPKHPVVRQASPGSATVDRTPRPSHAVRPVEPRPTTAPIRQRPSPSESSASSASKPQTEPATPVTQAQKNEQKTAQADTAQKAARTGQSTPPAQDLVQDPVARVALGYVGADPVAEMYWYGAINDPSLPAHERQDLIEDLNEDGFSDPRNPTMDDLPLILNRLQLIEAVAGDAMDEVNADAFQEAYKDLVNLAFKVLANG